MKVTTKTIETNLEITVDEDFEFSLELGVYIVGEDGREFQRNDVWCSFKVEEKHFGIKDLLETLQEYEELVATQNFPELISRSLKQGNEEYTFDKINAFTEEYLENFDDIKHVLGLKTDQKYIGRNMEVDKLPSIKEIANQLRVEMMKIPEQHEEREKHYLKEAEEFKEESDGYARHTKYAEEHAEKAKKFKEMIQI